MGPTPVCIVIVVAFIVLSAFVAELVYDVSYPSFATWLYSKFSGISTLYVPVIEVCASILSNTTKYFFTSFPSFNSSVHPFSGFCKSFVAFLFSE